MAIEKAIAQAPSFYNPPKGIEDIDPESDEGKLEIAIVNPESVSIETEDGGIIIDLEPGDEGGTAEGHDDNIAEFCDDSCLQKLSSQLIGDFEGDKGSRSDWERTYVDGLDLLGLKPEDRSTPWPGACGVHHPILTEAVIRFQSQAITEVFPSSGPVKTKIVGPIDKEKEAQATRVRDYLNYLLTEQMTEFRPEMEQLLFSLPLAGSAFKKVYYDPNMGRTCCHFVPAEDFVVSYGTSDLISAERYTHVMRKSKNEVRKLQVAGLYRDVDLVGSHDSVGDIQEKYDELEGDSPSFDNDNRHVLLEMHVNLDMEGYEDTGEDGEPTGIALPYVVTIARGSNQILAIRRNWYEDDPLRMKRMHFVHYQYMPGLGFYGFGLIHLIGGIAKTATSLTRQLVDAGTLANLPGGLKARGLRIKGDDSPILPGEFRDVDVPGGAIRDNITFLPYKEPSNVLHQMLAEIVEEGRRFASLTDLKLADMKQDAPVGTTLALIERSMKVMTAIQARLHAAMKREFVLVSDLVRDYAPEDGYDYKGGEQAVKSEDFDKRVDVIPVSDPNSSTMSQRIMQYQAALTLSQQAPQMYDLPELHRQMLDVLGIQDAEKIIPLSEERAPRDPVSENMDVLNSKPLKAFIYQDHEAHMQVHIAAIEDPKIKELVSQSPMAGAIAAAMAAHIQEHLGFKYRSEIEKQLGVDLPAPDQPLPEDIEVKLSRLVAKAADRLFNKNVADAQQQQIQQQMQDPTVQLQKAELDLRGQELERKKQADKTRVVADMAKAEMKKETETKRINTQAEIDTMRLGIEVAKGHEEINQKQDEINKKEAIERAKIVRDAGKALLDSGKKRG